jgi:glutamate dehydrogenase
MLDTSAEAKQALVRRIADRARRKARGARKRDAGQFVSQFFANIAPADLVGVPEDVLLGRALSVWQHMQTRRPGKPKIRIFNPASDKAGWNSPHTAIQIVNDDMPFLVDSVTGALNVEGLTVHIIIHPVVRLRRGANGRMLEFCGKDDRGDDIITESVMHVEINEQTGPDAPALLGQRLAAVLDDVRAAVGDWHVMRERIAAAVAELDEVPASLTDDEVAEAKSFLRWVEDNHFTFLGYREYRLESEGRGAARLSIVPKTGLGILRRKETTVFDRLQEGGALPPDIAEFMQRKHVLMVSKANTRSTVHRAAHLDTIGIKCFDRDGQVIGERLFAGLFTSDVYFQQVSEIPMLRRKVAMIVDRAGVVPTSHDGKTLLHILETLPRDELLQVGVDELLATSIGILQLQERQRIALFVHHDPFGRHVSCFVFVPRDRHDSRLRRTMQHILEDGFGGAVTAFYTQLGDSPLARLHFVVKTTPGQPQPKSTAEIEAALVEAGRDWREDLGQSLVAAHGEARGLALFRVHGEAFPSGYRERFDSGEAVFDVACIEETLENGDVGRNLYKPAAAADSEVRLKLYARLHPLPLSDVLPMLENMGLKVIDEVPHHISPVGREDGVYIHDFGLVLRSGARIDLDAVKANFEEAFGRIWSAEMENDGFNRLVIGAGLSWRQVVILRACCKFLLQAAIPFSQAYMEETLGRYPHIASMIVELFEARFDPAAQDQAAARAKRLDRRIETALESVAALDDDRILRRFANVVRSMLRTNFYQPAADGAPKPYLSFKLDSRAIEDLPLPRPLVEIFVHSPRVDAVHLRGGRVARGGIRWSDRREDFRTEILGLMKSQMTKNAIIVPVGAKGGFFVKQPPLIGDREAYRAEGIECYKTLMRGMLDITDNIVSGKVVPPENVVRYDGDDPYLVVAADKGTATFSDIANGVARDYGFWLDDAFASGGSAGYDHKQMGITARGAWESVKRHFREMGADVQSEPFTCVGVGDMAGDVFGNGMLNSDRTKLVAAFNHMHIFIDPDPDPKKSFAERRRLFDMPRSSWADYDARLISKGGGIFERSAKAIALSPQIRKLLELDKEKATPHELIRAILRAKVDLLFFGGIGTYIKSEDETHPEVGDRANDALRLDGREVRARVIGEGANLGCTQLGRVEYALSGGRINTDFIDNSAGVSCSDHEVNIKILFGEALARRKLTLAQRDRMLSDMTDEVARLVLMDNYRQSMALTHAEHQSVAMLDEHARFMRTLEREGDLDRAVEFLPDDETLDTRRAARCGLTRPELSVLLAYAKNVLFDELMASDVPDDEYLARGLPLYFPQPMQKKFGALIPEHRLRREIIATYAANTIVNRTGPSFIVDMSERTGAQPAMSARAYFACREVYRIAELWAGVEALDNNVPAEMQTQMHLEILGLIRRGTLWFIGNGPRGQGIDDVIKAFAPGAARLEEKLGDILSPWLKIQRARKVESYTASKVPEALARRVANLEALAPACDIVCIATSGNHTPEAVGAIYYAIGSQFDFDWLRGAAQRMPVSDQWQRRAVATLIDDLYACQAALAEKVLHLAGSADIAAAVVDTWAETHAHVVARARGVLSDLKTALALDVSMLTVAGRELRTMAMT